ncbi:MAG: hypothetical protein OQK73_06950 [Gammaproteobacteria bacterium]|nr:hypothetical protein [Gammaproteobacteria bacterium]
MLFNRYTVVIIATALVQGCGGGSGEESSETPDPSVEDFGVAYVKRAIPVDENGDMVDEDVRDPLPYRAGGDLYYRKYALPSAIERSITNGVTNGLGDVKDVEVSWDGSKLVFALRLGDVEGLQDDEQPTWNIWEYNITAQSLRRIMSSDLRAEEGQDVAPHYLPDGRIVFSSTRQRRSKAIQLDENKPQFTQLNEDNSGPAFNIHVMNADGTDIQQLTFNRSNDLDPVVLNDGKILFSRWDNAGSNDQISLYKMNPDGSNLYLHYGINSGNTGTDGDNVQFIQPREMPDGRILTLLRPQTGTFKGSDIIVIDTDNFVDNTQTVYSSSSTGQAQESITPDNVRTDTAVSPGGRYRAAYPLADGTQRLLVSWTACRLMQTDGSYWPCTADRLADTTLVEAPPLYSLYLYDISNNTKTPVLLPVEGIIYEDVVAAHKRVTPSVSNWRNDRDFDATLVDEGAGILNIRSVYDFDGVFNNLGSSSSAVTPTQMGDQTITTAAQRPARFLRVLKPASIPEGVAVTTFGRTRAQGMWEILAYAPIEPDGSVKLKVPADVPLRISVLDDAGRRIGEISNTGRRVGELRHQNWIQLRPGDVINCNGCHDPDSTSAHGRPDAVASLVVGDTMAEQRHQSDPTSINSSVDLVYTDTWYSTAPDINYLYSDLSTTAPASATCITEWTSRCRTIINYETHIHPIWGVNRQVLDTDGVTVLDDNTCTNCHSPSFNNVAQVPAGQLDLTDGASNDQPLHYNSYRELFFGDTELELDNGVLQERLVRREDPPGTPVLDIDGNEIFDTVSVSPSMSINSARVSYFMEKMNEQELNAGRGLTTTENHAGMLTAAELRLIAEWLDIGGQYYNNSYDLP